MLRAALRWWWIGNILAKLADNKEADRFVSEWARRTRWVTQATASMMRRPLSLGPSGPSETRGHFALRSRSSLTSFRKPKDLKSAAKVGADQHEGPSKRPDWPQCIWQMPRLLHPL
jgi:hypothetical protein